MLLRTLLVGSRLFAVPARYWNAEESYNASVAWLLGHGALWPQGLDLQYRSFCGGCTVVSLAAAPLLGLADLFVVWKGLALLWAAATMVLGFFALDRWVGRAGAWAWALLCAVPPPGAADLSLMLWGNHQETALLAVLALLLLARERGFWLGLVLGFALWFARTAAFQSAVLLPAAMLLLPGQRPRTLLGFGLGLLLFLLPVAAGDAGFYRMSEVFAFSPAQLWTRGRTLFSPSALALRMYLRPTGLGWAAAALLGAAALSTGLLLRTKRTWIFPALAAAYALAYCATTFPLFIAAARLPVNNIRYHAPWFFSLTLLVAAGAGRAWGRARWLSALLVAAAGVGSLAAWATAPPLRGAGDLWTMRASNPVQLAQVATPRLPIPVLAQAKNGDPAVDMLLRRMYGLRLGDEVVQGRLSRAEALTQAGEGEVLVGLGQTLTTPCADPGALNTWLDTLDPEIAAQIGRGAAITLGLCHADGPPEDIQSRLAALRSPRGCWLCGAAGAAALDGCATQHGPATLGRCLGESVTGLVEADRVLYGAGVLSARPTRSTDELAEIADAIGARGDAFLAGTRDPMAGISEPYTSERPTDRRPLPSPAPRRSTQKGLERR